MASADLTVLSLGAGVQSTVLALMAAAGEIEPQPDLAIFSDTVWEPPQIYKHLDWLETQLPFPVERLRDPNRSILEDLLSGRNSTNQPFITVPAYGVTESGQTAIMGRQCTAEYKVRPFKQRVREHLGLKPRQRAPKGLDVEVWLGYSTDEITRVKGRRETVWMRNRYPLLELRRSRADCEHWFAERYPGRPLHRSACQGCPYHSEEEWKRLYREDPQGWKEAVLVDEALRAPGIRNTRMRREYTFYLHRSLTPLRDLEPLYALDAATTPLPMFGDGFDSDCGGHCGL